MLIGGNLGDRTGYLRKARELIRERCGDILSASSLYETAAWGLTDQPAFYNQALVLSTSLTPEELMQQLLRIEEEMGRKRILKMGPRIIDLDILLVDDTIMHNELLTLPHPSLPARRFALLPLAEIAPGLVHPVLQKNIAQLLEECTDLLDVQKKSTDA